MTRHPEPGLTIPEAARHLGVSVRTIQRRLRAGQLDAYKVHTQKGHEWRIRVASGATDDATDLAVSPQAVTHVGSALVDATPPPTPEGAELAVLALRALDEVRRENDRLRAMVESLQRPWWRKGWEKIRRRP